MEIRSLRLLIADDSPDEADITFAAFKAAGYQVKSERVQDLSGLRSSLAREWDALLIEADLPALHPIAVLELLRREDSDLPCIILTPALNDDEHLRLMKAGARDVVFKDQAVRLVPVVVREIEVARLRCIHRTVEGRLKESESRYRAMLDGAGEPVCRMQDGVLTEANAGYLQLFGFASLAAAQETPLLNIVSAGDQARIKGFIRKAAGEQEPVTIEFSAQRVDGQHFPVRLTLTVIRVEGERFQQLTFQDQTHAKSLESRVQYLAQRDALTGLNNRYSFLEALRRAIDGVKQGTPAVLLHFDAREIRAINQRLGYAAGDRTLLTLSRLLRERCGEKIMLARLGGAVFSALFTGDEVAGADTLKTTLVAPLSAWKVTDQKESLDCPVTLQFAAIDAGAASAEVTMAAFERPRALPEPSARTSVPEAPVPEATGAGSGDERSARLIEDMRILFQAIVPLSGSGGDLYEVIPSPSAGSKLSLAEWRASVLRFRLGRQLDHRTLEGALAAIPRTRSASGSAARYLIPLTLDTWRDDVFLRGFPKTLEAAGLKTTDVLLALSSQDMVESGRSLAVLLQQANKLGFRIAVSDFGNCPAAIPLCKHAAVELLKLDAALLRGMKQEALLQPMLQVINQAATALGKSVVAPEVNDADTLAALWSLGIQLAQGDYFQKPQDTPAYSFETEQVDSEQVVAGWVKG